MDFLLLSAVWKVGVLPKFWKKALLWKRSRNKLLSY